MRQILQLSIYVTAILVASSFANAEPVQLHIEKTSTVNIKDLANQTEIEASEAASNMRGVYTEPDQDDESSEVRDFVEAEVGHSEAATASTKMLQEKSPN